MNKVKNFFAIAIASIVATSSLTVGASALTRISRDGVAVCGELTHAGTGYWYGHYESANVNIFGNSFSDSEYASFSISNGRTVGITGKQNYTGNYKTVSVTVASASTSKYSTDGGNSTTVDATASSPGTIIKANYMGEIYNGTGSGADFLDGYIITVN